MLEIINKTRLDLPGYIPDSLQEISRRAQIAPTQVQLIVKRRNRRNRRRIRNPNADAPSGCYKLDFRTVILHMGPNPNRDDVRFVLAHEIGHLKAHLEARPVQTLRNLTNKDYGETKANHFALKVCHCYPVSYYPGTKRSKA